MLEAVALVGVKARLLCRFRFLLECRGMFYGFRASLGFRVLFWGSFFTFFFFFALSCILSMY
jgi:hypothetical protein